MSKLLDTNKNSDISERAKSIIKYAKDNNTISVISIFKNLCIPFNNKNPKKRLFKKIFDLANIDYTWDEKLGFIIFSEKITKKTIVSHMDLIKVFNNGFEDDKTHEIKNKTLYGALDNTFTNAVLINSILNKRDKNTTYLFTLDEETTQYAIRDYMKRFGINQFIINMDITNDGYEKNMSIEYDEPCYHICKQIDENMNNPYFTTKRECDDLDQVMKAGGFGFSYCLPTKGNIHSYKNNVPLDKIEPYMNGLDFLAHKLDLECYTPNIKYSDINRAIKYESYEKFTEKDVYETSTEKKNYKEIDISKNRDIFTKEFNDYLSKSKVNNKKFRNYVFNTITKKGKFSSGDMILNFPKLDFSEIENKKFIKYTHSGYFKFRGSLVLNKKESIRIVRGLLKNLEGLPVSKKKKRYFPKNIDYSNSEFTRNFNEFLDGLDGNKQKFIDFVNHKIKNNLSFGLMEFTSLFQTVNINDLQRRQLIYSSDTPNSFGFVGKNLFLPLKKEIDTKKDIYTLILEVTALFDKYEKKNMEIFLNLLIDNSSFSERYFDKRMPIELLYFLEDYNLVKRNVDGDYEINKSFYKKNAFKAWKIADSSENIISNKLFYYFSNKVEISFDELKSLEKNKDIQKTDLLITELMKHKLIKFKKKRNIFKIL